MTLCADAGWFAGILPPALAREVVATPGMCLAGSGAATGIAQRTADGWRIDGRWGHATGAPHASHFTFNAVLYDCSQPLRDAALAWARTAREAVDSVNSLCGLTAADPRTELNRAWRDLHTATQHAMLL